MKRLFDLAFSTFFLFTLFPLFLFIAILIKLDSPGPVFYRTVRVGKDGEPFRLYKFRSMAADAASKGPGITHQGDPRVTRVGNWLRRFKLDELPQLINVCKGEMSLVGPRPEDPRYVALYTPEQRAVLTVAPGVTSAASLRFRHEGQLLTGTNWEDTYLQVILPEKLKIDLDYIQRCTFATDLLIIWQTFLALFR
jgi:lipopolysaccharide/colanic/teichoic acid biosynthesis glycosyltransferase